ncbi:MAG: sulfatase-like hydrolase/transferase [Oligosphaeraceae bacterium]|nr:sulfatase-like hydrolase/transferase [Oligosphaeraceae bacterium]
MTTKKRPNILLILADDQGAWALPEETAGELRAPNLQHLVDTGMQFRDFFCTCPVCSPARASLLTGRLPSQHGVHDWLAAGNTVAEHEPARGGLLLPYLQNECAYTQILAAAGYRCGLSGKWHLGDCHHPQQGFSFWQVYATGGGSYYGAAMIRNGELYHEKEYVTDAITTNALHWLEEISDQPEPFYLSVHYTAPHSPWDRSNHPEDIYADYYQNCAFRSLPENLPPPEWVEGISIPVRDAETRRSYLSGYFTAITAMDANIGRLLDWLEQSGKAEDTLVIFTSDNGMNMGQHGIYGKGNATWPLNMFEESVRVPLLIAHPGSIAPGRQDRHLLSQYDFMPTLLDYIGLEIPEGLNLPGRSFAPLLQGQALSEAREVVVYDEYGPVRMLRTPDWKLVVRNQHGPDELYNLRRDPGETCNLSGHPEAAARERQLRGQLLDWFQKYAVPEKIADGKLVDGYGQYGLCSEPEAFPGRRAYQPPER